MFIEEAVYAEIVKSMPIPCVDLVVMDKAGRILLLKRKNEPASNQWWFPGGRVLFGELRSDAARRKIKEECGLFMKENPIELGTIDCLLNLKGNKISHGITTFFKVLADSAEITTLDGQSCDSSWAFLNDWQAHHNLHPIVLTGMSMALSAHSSAFKNFAVK